MSQKPPVYDPDDEDEEDELNPKPRTPAPVPVEKKRRFSRRVLIIGAIVLIFICGGIGSLLPDDAASPAATEAPLPTATDEPLPTDTAAPAPTETAEPPPTRTPRPTAAPTEAPPDDSAAVLEYRAAIQEIAGLYQTGLSGLADQSGAVGDDPALILNEDWKITTAVFLASIRVANDQVRSQNPPEEFRAVHDELLVAADHFETMTELYAAGVDEISVEKLAGASESMQLGNEAVQRATALLVAMD